MEWKALDINVVVVAIQGGVKDWSAYIGAVPGDNHEKEWRSVADHGTKLPKEFAFLLFPNWAEELMWRE